MLNQPINELDLLESPQWLSLESPPLSPLDLWPISSPGEAEKWNCDLKIGWTSWFKEKAKLPCFWFGSGGWFYTSLDKLLAKFAEAIERAITFLPFTDSAHLGFDKKIHSIQFNVLA